MILTSFGELGPQNPLLWFLIISSVGIIWYILSERSFRKNVATIEYNTVPYWKTTGIVAEDGST